MKFSSVYWKLVCVGLCFGIVFVMGCGQKEMLPQTLEVASLSTTIVEIDDYGNAGTDLEMAAFTERGWELGDTFEVTFGTNEPIAIKFVENYGDVPVGDYLGRFSTSTGRFKIAINEGNISKALKLEMDTPVVLRKSEPVAE